MSDDHQDKSTSNTIYQMLAGNSKKTSKTDERSLSEKDPNSLESIKKENKIQFEFFLEQFKIAAEREQAEANSQKEARQKRHDFFEQLKKWEEELKNFFLTLAKTQLENTHTLMKLTLEQISSLNTLLDNIDEKIKAIVHKIAWLEQFILQRQASIAHLQTEKNSLIISYVQTFKSYFSSEKIAHFKPIKIPLIMQPTASTENIDNAFKKFLEIQAADIQQIVNNVGDEIISGKIRYEEMEMGLKNEILSYVKNELMQISLEDLLSQDKEMFTEINMNTVEMKNELEVFSNLINDHITTQDINNNYALKNTHLQIVHIDVTSQCCQHEISEAQEIITLLQQTKDFLENTQHEITNIQETPNQEYSFDFTSTTDNLTNLLNSSAPEDLFERFQNDMLENAAHIEEDFSNFRPF